jgi:hypothetical protein
MNKFGEYLSRMGKALGDFFTDESISSGLASYPCLIGERARQDEFLSQWRGHCPPAKGSRDYSKSDK